MAVQGLLARRLVLRAIVACERHYRRQGSRTTDADTMQAVFMQGAFTLGEPPRGGAVEGKSRNGDRRLERTRKSPRLLPQVRPGLGWGWRWRWACGADAAEWSMVIPVRRHRLAFAASLDFFAPRTWRQSNSVRRRSKAVNSSVLILCNAEFITSSIDGPRRSWPR